MCPITSKHFLSLHRDLSLFHVTIWFLIRGWEEKGGVAQMGYFPSRRLQLPLHICAVCPKGISLGAKSDHPAGSSCSGELSAWSPYDRMSLHVQAGEKMLLLSPAFPSCLRIPYHSAIWRYAAVWAPWKKMCNICEALAQQERLCPTRNLWDLLPFAQMMELWPDVAQPRSLWESFQPGFWDILMHLSSGCRCAVHIWVWAILTGH